MPSATCGAGKAGPSEPVPALRTLFRIAAPPLAAVARLRNCLYDHLQPLLLSHHQEQDRSQILHLLSRDTDIVGQFSRHSRESVQPRSRQSRHAAADSRKATASASASSLGIS